MSESTANSAVAQTAPERSIATPERPIVVIGIALGLLVLIGVVGAIILVKTKSVDARELFTKWFGESALPFDFAPREAALLATGEEVVRLAPEVAVVEPALKTPPPAPSQPWYASFFGDNAASGDAASKFDWTKLDARPAGDAPCEAMLVHYPAEGSPAQLDQLFVIKEKRDPKTIGPGGGRAVLDQGDLPWGTWSSRYVLEREFEAGGTFRDVIRVNLARPKDAKVLFVRFPRGSTGSTARVSELLGVLTPR